LPIGIEGQAGVGGTATVGALYTVERPSESEGLFGVDSNLDKLVKFVLGRGVSPVIAGASIKGTYSSELVERQVVWANMESDEHIRIRLTDTEVQANIAALADSYDNAGVLLGGKFAAAAVAAEVAMNPDIADDLDTAPLVNLTGIEKDAVGLPVFRRKVVAGVAQNDFEDLLQGGVSVLKQGVDGGVEITHLRTTYTTDGTFDSLMTRLIVDQIFLIVKGYCKQFLRRGNDETTRQALKSGVEALLNERRNWIRPKTLPDGTEGYVVTVTSSSDGRQLTVAYEGSVVRGVSTIQVAAKLDIAV
jgi:hypothetical protein